MKESPYLAPILEKVQTAVKNWLRFREGYVTPGAAHPWGRGFDSAGGKSMLLRSNGLNGKESVDSGKEGYIRWFRVRERLGG